MDVDTIIALADTVEYDNDLSHSVINTTELDQLVIDEEPVL